MNILNVLFFYDESNYDDILRLIKKTAIKTYGIDKNEFKENTCEELIELMEDLCKIKEEEKK